MNPPANIRSDKIPRVVIIGGGFGGLEVAKRLCGGDMHIVLLDRTNYHLFQPLLYQVATAGLSPADIAGPLRSITRRCKNLEVILGDARHINPAEKTVTTDDLQLHYDYLIVAAGARHSYFGRDEWETFAPGLKTIEDALEIRRRILTAFELAERTDDVQERTAALTFVIVGGGPTGVEMAGAIAELARFTLVRDFRRIDPSQAKIILVDMMPRVLPSFAEKLSEMAHQQLAAIGVDVRTEVAVQQLSERGVEIQTNAGALEFIAAKTVIWAAGNAASPLAKTLGVPLDRQGRVIVNHDLTIQDHPEVQVIGDLANFSHTPNGKPLPGVSPVAIQQGRHAADNINAMIAGGPRKKFVYVDRGSMATIGRNRAVADLHFARFGGFLAWFAWLFVHLIFLIGFRNKLFVLVQWAWNYFTYGRGARLITGRSARE